MFWQLGVLVPDGTCAGSRAFEKPYSTFGCHIYLVRGSFCIFFFFSIKDFDFFQYILLAFNIIKLCADNLNGDLNE